MSPRDRLQRRVIPRAIVALSTIRFPARAGAALRRARGGRGRVDLYVAFDDPNSAVAALGLSQRLGPRPADLHVAPVVARGIPDDPAVEDKRRYAVVDARRLARRNGLAMTRTEPVDPAATAFLARWATAIPDAVARAAFCTDAMYLLWFATAGAVGEDQYLPLWRSYSAGEPPSGGDAARAERKMRKAGLYDTPVAVVHGEWFFAHERLEAVEHRLDELGWVAA